MNPGELKQILIFQQPPGGTDSDGFPITQPIFYLKTWAKLKTLRGNTLYVAAQTQNEHNREFIIRYQKKLKEGVRPPKLQVVWNGVTHDIVSIENDDGHNKTMTVICKAVK